MDRERLEQQARAAWAAFRRRVRRALDVTVVGLRALGARLRRASRHRIAVPRLRSSADQLARSDSGSRAPGTVVVSGDDDLASVIGKIDTADQPDILLVVPREARSMREPMVWPRIVAHAQRRGITVRVLAARRDVANAARAAGLRGSRSARGLRGPRTLRVPIGAREFRLRAPNFGPLLRGAAFIAVVLVVIGGACYAVPSAEIVIEPSSTSAMASATVRINPVADELDLVLGVVPASTVQITIVTVVAAATTGTTSVGDERATVELVFTNDGETDIELPAGTDVNDEGGITFKTDVSVTVLAADSVTVAGTAVLSGEAANLASGELRLLIGLADALTVTNPESASGGTDKEVPAIAQEDVDRVRDIAPQVLEVVGRRELLATFTTGILFAETASAAILRQEPLGVVGQPGDAFLMEYTAVVSALYLSEEAAIRFGQALLLQSIEEGHALLPGTTAVHARGDGVLQGGELTVELVVTGLVTSLFEASAVRGELTGVSPETAADWLQENLGLTVTPRINVSPDWLPAWRMPLRASRITITLVGPGQSEPADEAGPDVDSADADSPDVDGADVDSTADAGGATAR